MSIFTKSLRKHFTAGSKDLRKAFQGWNYALNFDNKYFSNINKKRKKKSYEYEFEPKDLNLELLELEDLNKSTNLEIKPAHASKVAIIGCGPVGMAAGLWIKKAYPDIDISIYETRVDLTKNKLKPFSRRWLTHLQFDSIEAILNHNDKSILKQIGINNYLGVDIRNLEFSLLRAINKQGINICQLIKNIPNPNIIIDASGGKLITHDQSKVKRKFLVDREVLLDNSRHGHKICPIDRFNKFEIVDFGNIIKPFHNGIPFQIPYLKINYLPPKLKKDFVYFSNELHNDYGVYYWDGVMRDDLNHSLLFLSLYENEFRLIDDIINSPIRLDKVWEDNIFRSKITKRLSKIFEWLLTNLEKDKMCYLEPLFLWEPFYVARKKMYIFDNIEYINTGDSHYIGHPKLGNGLSNHLRELKDAFSNNS